MLPSPSTPSSNSSAWSEELNQLQLEILQLRSKNAGLRQESASLQVQHDAAQAHAVFSGQQFSVYKHHYNKKVDKKPMSKKTTTSAHILVSKQARLEIANDATKKVEKQKAEAEKEA